MRAPVRRSPSPRRPARRGRRRCRHDRRRRRGRNDRRRQRGAHDPPHERDVRVRRIEPPAVGDGIRQVRVEGDAAQHRPVLVGQRQQRRQQRLRDVRGDRRRGRGRDLLEVDDDVRRALLRHQRADEAALAAHAVVVVGVAPRAGEPQRLVAVEVLDPGGHVAVGGDVAAAVGDAADRQRVGPDVDGHPAQCVDQRGQPVHVHHDVVGHREPEHRRDRRHQQVQAAIGGRSGGGQRGVRAAVLRDVVEQVVARRRRARVVEPVGEPGRCGGARRERRVLDVAGEREQRRGRGPGVDARDDHGVGPRARAVRTGVAAQQQDVHAGRQHRTGRHGRSGSRGGVRREHPVEQGALGVGEVRGGTERDGHAGAERHGDRGAEHLVTGAAGAGVRRDEGPHDDRDPGDHDEDAEDRDREQDTRRHEAAQQAGAAEVGGGAGHRRRADQEDPHHPDAGAPTAEHDVPEAGDGRGGRDGTERAADPDRPRTARRSRPGTASDQGHEADARCRYRDIRLERARMATPYTPVIRDVTDGEPLASGPRRQRVRVEDLDDLTPQRLGRHGDLVGGVARNDDRGLLAGRWNTMLL